VSTLTFVGSVGPIVHRGATPVFIDSDPESWNMDPALLERALDERPGIRAVVVVHLYGQSADLDPIRTLCERRGIPLIEDAAEAAGTLYRGRHVGNEGVIGYFSFNGNKIITASNGGMVVTPDEAHATRIRKLATQAREPAPHYEHTELGYNYRLSNILAALGLAQLRKLDLRVAQRRRNFEYYQQHLGDLPGIVFMPEPAWGRTTRWLTVLTIDPEQGGTTRDAVRERLSAHGIEARPVWKPMHRQPALRDRPAYISGCADHLFEDGLCLPSGSSLSEEDLARVATVVREAWRASSVPSL
jgi:pyridoxal phosphate-dependent aminotransferase EpsN